MYPILGDSVYGKKDGFLKDKCYMHMLEFVHPITNEKMLIKAKLHEDFFAS